MLVAGRRIHDGSFVTVHIDGCRIDRVSPGIEPRALGGASVWLSPGFHDLQVNGYAGNDFNAGSWKLERAEEPNFAALRRALARHGTALFCPTVVTDGPEQMLANLRRIAAALAADPGLRRAVTGIHLEGPFLSPDDGPRGAHPLEHVREPDLDLFERFQDAAAGGIRLVTLAPELPGALSLIERLVEQGIIVAIGHTGCSASRVREAVAAGATLSTHIGNGCHASIPRHDSYLWEQLASDDLTATLIADGHHVETAEALVFARAKGIDKIALISDAVTLAGLPPGLYGDGRFEVTDRGPILLAGTPYLAGAVCLLDVCVANLRRWLSLSLSDAVGCATAVPARVLGLAPKGRLEAGFDADLTLFRETTDDEIEIKATITGGELVYEASRDGDLSAS